MYSTEDLKDVLFYGFIYFRDFKDFRVTIFLRFFVSYTYLIYSDF